MCVFACQDPAELMAKMKMAAACGLLHSDFGATNKMVLHYYYYHSYY